jgi:cobalt-precorrin 5A hydrolase
MMRAAVLSFSRQGGRTARKIEAVLQADMECSLYAPQKYAEAGIEPVQGELSKFAGKLMKAADALIFVGACGIAVRAIAPHIQSKVTDPAVICVDELGTFSIALLSGHIGGGNRLARMIAAGLNATAVVTTATDVNGRFSVDAWAAEQGFLIGSMKAAKDVSAAILERDIPITSDVSLPAPLPAGLYAGAEGPLGISVSVRDHRPFCRTLAIIPQALVLGLGCRRGTSCETIEEAVREVFKENGLELRAVRSAASIDLKADEPGLLAFCERARIPITFYSAAVLSAARGEFTPSSFVQGITGVDNVCERSAVMSGGTLIVKKTARRGVTVAVTETEWEVRFG